MTSDGAYALWIRCFNQGTFEPLGPYLRPDCVFASIDSIYTYEGPQRVVKQLSKRFGLYAGYDGQAFSGFVQDRGLFDEPHYRVCALITGPAKQDVRFLVRLTLKLGKITRVEFCSPEGETYTRGEKLT
ncbi:MAG: hypothetical protein PHD32_00880 [Eubacteriales bacterium]|nr:hypothetical protein [Eubacteriales bacterium]